MSTHLRSFALPAVEPARAVCVILHGLGDSHLGMAGLAAELRLPEVRYVLPDAPDRYTVGYSWYTIPPEFFDAAGRMSRERLVESCREEVQRSRRAVHALLDDLRGQYPALPLLLGGFSQGGLIALDAGLTWSGRVGAIFSLSSYFPQARSVLAEVPSGVAIPVFIGHGEADSVVAHEFALETKRQLEEHGVAVEFHSYAGLDHGIDGEELDHLRAFIRRRLSAGTAPKAARGT